MGIPFNKPYLSGKELEYIKEAYQNGHLAGDGSFTKKCQTFLENRFGCPKVLLTHSGTAALEMGAILANIQLGDEVILPSYTFVSTANAFVMRGAVPIFIDIRKDTLNIDEAIISNKISRRTKVICPVHYAGVGCEMDTIMGIANENNLLVIEDAAHGINAKYKNKYLGTIGHVGSFSFHETKNYICGEGGALLVNDEEFFQMAEIIREKGTDRSKFFRGEVDKYTWIDIGSSYLPSDILAAFLYAQFENFEEIADKRKKIFEYYYDNFKDLENTGKIKLLSQPEEVTPNYHMFYIILPTNKIRDKIMSLLQNNGIHAIFHYIPLHLSPMGKSFAYKAGDLPVTEDLSGRLLRLPFYNAMTKKEQDCVIDNLRKLLLKI